MKKESKKRKPGKSKKRPSSSRSKALKPQRPPDLSSSHYDMERLHRAMDKILAGKDFETAEEMNAFLESFMKGRAIEDIIDEVECTPEGEAQDIAYLAMEAESAEEAYALSLMALGLDPNNVDAGIIAATVTSTSLDDYAFKLRALIRRAEAAFGKEHMNEAKGHFWGVVETRPYMRAREELVTALVGAERFGEAIAECEAMLELNPNDNQGIRDHLLGLYLRTGDVVGARGLMDRYPETFFAVFNWGRVLERLLSHDLGGAEKARAHAHKGNPHVAAYLTGARRLPKGSPDHYSPGDQSEAVVCAEILGPAWREHPEAIPWLKAARGA